MQPKPILKLKVLGKKYLDVAKDLNRLAGSLLKDPHNTYYKNEKTTKT